MFVKDRFRDRFALGAGIYIGSWGTHIYIDIWQWFFGYESGNRQAKIVEEEDKDSWTPKK